MKKYILFLIIILCFSIGGYSQWHWYNPITDGYYLYDVSTLSPDNAWAVGNRGKILHFDGQSWTPVASGTDQHLRGVFFTDSGHGWAVGLNGTILCYENGNWSAMQSNTTLALADVAFTSPGNGWAVGYGLLHYDGNSWTTFDTIGFEGVNKVAFLSENNGWTGGTYCLYKYSSQGWSWHPIFNDGIYTVETIFLLDSLHGWLGGWRDDFIPFLLDDPATGWKHVGPCPEYVPTGLHFDSPDHGWACTSSYMMAYPQYSVWEFSNNGWQPSKSLLNPPMEMDGCDAENFFVLLAYGHILAHDSSGYRLSNSLAEGAIELSFPDTSHGWLVGKGEEILKYSMGHLMVDTVFPGMVFQRIHFADMNHGIAAASLKTDPRDWSLYLYNDMKWHFLGNGLTDINGVCALSNREAWASAGYYNDGKVYHVSGGQLTSQTFPGIGLVWGISFSDPDHGWIGCQKSSFEDCYIYKYSYGDWSEDYTSAASLAINSISMSSYDYGWAVGRNFNSVVTWKYNGQAWTKVTDVPAPFTAIYSPGPGVAYGISNNTLCTYSNGVWSTEVLSLDNQPLKSISVPQGLTTWLGGANGAVLSTQSPFPVGEPDPGEKPVPFSVKLSPNPCTSHATLYYSVTHPGAGQLSVTGPDGRIVKQYPVNSANAGRQTFSFSTGDLKAGIYLFRFRSNDGTGTGKLVKID